MRDFSNQLEIFNPDNWIHTVHVIGVGQTGAMVFFALNAKGVDRINLYDPDVVEGKNIASQAIYRPSDIGRPKVESAVDFARRQEWDTEIDTYQVRVDESTFLDGVVICCVDNMESRQAIWSQVITNPEIRLFIDVRVSGHMFQVFCVSAFDPDQQEHRDAYQKWLFDDSDAQQEACGAQAIIDTPLAVAAFVAAQISLYSQGIRPIDFLDGNLGTKAVPGHRQTVVRKIGER